MIQKAIKIIAILLIVNAIGCKKDIINQEPEELTVREIEGDYYVSVSGNDNNTGTKDNPWQTIQKAAETASAGNIVVVLAGTYDEFVTIKNNGQSENAKLTFFSETLHGAKCRGFRIQGDYVSIDGFNIESQNSTNWIGITIYGATHTDILNSYVHDCPTGGITIIYGAEYAKLKDNKIEHNGQWGINVTGFGCLIEGNEISKTVQYHPKGDEPGFSGNDADGIRLFGSNHIIKSNRIINIGDPEDSANIDPHADCIQGWDGNSSLRSIVTNTIIEGNYFSVSHPSGKGVYINASRGNTCHDIIIKNNIIEFCDIGLSLNDGDFNNISVLNNVFKANIGQSSWGTSMHFENVSNYKIINNITVDCHTEHRKITGGNGTIDYNLAWNSDGSAPTLIPGKQEYELLSVNPKFIEYTGNHNSNDYHLQSTSPAVNAGATLNEVLIDFDGVSRPQGTAYDIGAFEFTDK